MCREWENLTRIFKTSFSCALGKPRRLAWNVSSGGDHMLNYSHNKPTSKWLYVVFVKANNLWEGRSIAANAMTRHLDLVKQTYVVTTEENRKNASGVNPVAQNFFLSLPFYKCLHCLPSAGILLWIMPHLEIWELQWGNPQLALGLAQRLNRTEKRYVCILVKPQL